MDSLPRSAARVTTTLLGEPDGLTRDEIGRRTGLSRTAVHSATTRLLEDAVIEERPGRAGGVGRPPSRLVLRQPGGYVIGVDFGHSHMNVAVADRTGRLLAQHGPIDCDIEAKGVAAVDDAVEEIGRMTAHLDPARILAVAMGVPSPMAGGRVASRRGHLRQWAGTDVRGRLAQGLADRWDLDSFDAIVVENDANLGALGEGLHGVARDARTYAYVKVSSGIGLGLVIDGRLFRGAHAAAGEWGHVLTPAAIEAEIAAASTVELPRTACPICGRLDCLQNLASCTAIVEQVAETERRSGGETAARVALELEPFLRSLSDPRANPLHLQATLDAASRIAYALVDLIRTIDPELVIIGGLLALAKDIIEPTVQDILEHQSLPPATPRIVVLDEDRIKRSEIDGAIATALEEARRRSLQPA